MLMRQIKSGPLDNFSYILASGSGADCAVVDPGWDLDRIAALCEKDRLRVTHILNTHSHWDHIHGNAGLTEVTGARTVVHREGARILREQCPGADLIEVEDGDVLDVGGLRIEVLHTPGHSRCSVCFKTRDCLVTGDTLFVCECGRTDLAGGSPKEQFESFRRIRELEPGLEILSGHDYGPTPTATLASELQHNKFLKCRSLDELMALKTFV